MKGENKIWSMGVRKRGQKKEKRFSEGGREGGR